MKVLPAAFLAGGSPGLGEILLVLVALLLLFGARRMPSIARSLGRSLSQLRRAARDVSDELMRADIEEPEPLEPPRTDDAAGRAGEPDGERENGHEGR